MINDIIIKLSNILELITVHLDLNHKGGEVT